MPDIFKTAVIDIDNTLWQFCDVLYERLKKINDDIPTPDHWTGWDFFDQYFVKDDFLEIINNIHFNQANDHYVPYPEAKNFLSTLRQNMYRVIIASHRLPASRKQTETWLSRHELQYDELHLSFNKTALFNEFTEVVVDDSPTVLEKAVESGAVAAGLLFPWNKTCADNGCKLFHNLDDILSYILEG